MWWTCQEPQALHRPRRDHPLVVRAGESTQRSPFSIPDAGSHRARSSFNDEIRNQARARQSTFCILKWRDIRMSRLTKYESDQPELTGKDWPRHMPFGTPFSQKAVSALQSYKLGNRLRHSPTQSPFSLSSIVTGPIFYLRGWLLCPAESLYSPLLLDIELPMRHKPRLLGGISE